MHTADSGMAEHGDQTWNRKARADRISPFGRLIIFLSSRMKNLPLEAFTPDVLLTDGQSLAPYGLDASILSLPGHSKGSIGVLLADGSLFCGDLLMNIFQPNIHFMVDDSADLAASLEKLRRLPVKTVYPGHGKPFPFARLKRTQR